MNEGDFSEKLNELLSDPVRLAQITEIAQGFASGQAKSHAPPSPPPTGTAVESPLKLLPPGLLKDLTDHSRERTDLLRAVRPFLEPDRQAKVDRILSLLRTLDLLALMQK